MWVFEWTGENFLPAIKDPSLVYLHLHRYAHASEFLTGKRVLDLVSGDGSGANILAQAASSVVAVVADERIVRHASERYKKANLQFICGSITEIPVSGEDSFDGIVCFNEIEPDVDYGPVLLAVKRLLKQDGLFVLSSGMREERSANGRASHVEEFTPEKLRELLTSHFKDVQIFAQGIYANSSIWPIAPAADPALGEILMVRGDADEFERVRGDKRFGSCLIAVASDSPVDRRTNGSVFIDEGNELLTDKDKTIQELTESKAYQGKTLAWYETQLARRRESLASLQEGFAWQKSQITSLTKARDYLEGEVNHYKNTVASEEEALAWRASQVGDLEATVEELKKAVAWQATRTEDLQRDNERLQGEIDRLQSQVGQLQTDKDHLQSEMRQLGLQSEMHQLQAEKDRLQNEMDQLQREGDRTRILALELDAMKKSSDSNAVPPRSIRDRLLPRGGLVHRLYKKITRRGKYQ